MVGKLALVLKSKLAIAILGAVLIAAGGSAAAMAASGGSLQLPLIAHGQSTSQHANGGSHDDGNSQSDKHDDDQNGGHEADGIISSIDAGNSSFVLKSEHDKTVTVVAGSQTAFAGTVHSFGDLKVGMSVEVKGNAQSDGTLAATGIYGDDESAGDHHDSHDTNSSGNSTDSGRGGSGTRGSDGGSH